MAEDTFYPESWPGGRAPAEWWVVADDGGFTAHAQLWVADDLRWKSSYPLGRPTDMDRASRLAYAQRRAIEMARELEHERDFDMWAFAAGGAYGEMAA